MMDRLNIREGRIMSVIKGKLYVHVLLDRSGSMMANKSVTVRAYNEYIDSLGDDAVISLTMFSTGDLRHLRTNVGKGHAKISVEEYDIRGGTALYDAIGTTINMIDTQAKEYDRVALVLQTDGQEIDSREVTLAQVRQMLTDKQEGEGWLVVFLGANLDAFGQAAVMGLNRANTMQYSAANSAHALRAAGRATSVYASAENASVGRLQATFTDDERNKAK